VRLQVSRETQEVLRQFAALLLRWNRTVNLISRADEQHLWKRHIDDSLQLLPLMEPLPSRAIDLGSGAGFPGLVLALASGVHFDLIEADQRKCAFLREAARITGAPVKIHAVRIETAILPPAPLVCARALAPLPRLLEMAAPLLTTGGQCLLLKGTNAAAELTHAGAEWQMQVDQIPSRTDPRAFILRICNPTRVLPSA
jgi:16S rRNA (guanine527-N7)-methyltransferase